MVADEVPSQVKKKRDYEWHALLGWAGPACPPHRGQGLVLLLQLVVGGGERLLDRVQLVVGLLELLLQGAQFLLRLQGRAATGQLRLSTARYASSVRTTTPSYRPSLRCCGLLASEGRTHGRQRLVLLLEAGLGRLQRLLGHVKVVLDSTQLALDAAELIFGLT